ncbi:glycosyltransferase family 4 protein [Kiloniella sp. EL199]|uniref:glycosyltransferase family 4 protein n=1 Tax=Kiloniella sp. EL199 TaxID=2107581 RepID=UPI0013C422BF|nr:glycosyltransferase family 4 protein [Kiloniella sp. EL199]
MVTNIAFPFIGDSVGGSHISTLTLIRHLDTTKFKPFIVVHEEGPLSDFLDREGYEYTLLPIPHYAGTTPSPLKILADAARSAKPIRKYLKSSNINIIHGNDIRVNLTWSLSRLCMPNKFIWHQRALPKSHSPFWHAVPFLSDKIISISRAVETSIRRGKGTKIQTIHNPIEVRTPTKKKKNTSLRSQLNIPKSAIVLTFIGRLVSYKKPDLFIKIVHSLSKKIDRPIHGFIVGPDQEHLTPDLKELASSLGVSSNVHFFGFTSEVEALFRESNYLIAPCAVEAFGRTLIEAMMIGLPVVAANAGGHKEIVKDSETGLLCEVDNIEDFTSKIIQLETQATLKEQIILQAQNHTQKYYALDSHISQISNIYNKLAK